MRHSPLIRWMSKYRWLVAASAVSVIWVLGWHPSVWLALASGCGVGFLAGLIEFALKRGRRDVT
jgi:hypothetical protein